MRHLRRIRRGLGGTAVAAAAMAALTASQAPGPARHQSPAPGSGPVGLATARIAGPTDNSYHTEIPPLVTPPPPGNPADAAGAGPVWQESGIPATVLAAYRAAEAGIRRSDPGCHLPWQLLAAIGKVESGQARGGSVDAHGTTLTPILGPVLNGSGFAHIPDTDNGAYDGDTRYDRAVGPMQFIPSTWAGWGTDGNGDGKKDPNNVYDAALAAGHYLCAGDRDLAVGPGLDRAVLSYNHSDAYLRLVLSWLSFYRHGIHEVPDGEGVLPTSPGAGGASDTVGQPDGGAHHGAGGGIVIGPAPSHSPSAGPSSGPSGSPSGGPSGGDSSPTPSDGPSGSPSDPGSPPPSDPTSEPPTSSTPDPGTSSTPPECPTPSPSETGSPDPGDTGTPGDDCVPAPGDSGGGGDTASAGATAP